MKQKVTDFFVDVIVIAILVIIAWMCVTLMAIADPLPMKVDTVKVDTVGWVWVEDPMCCLFSSVEVDGVWEFRAVDSIWRPTIHYTTDTTYRLTPEQVGRIIDSFLYKPEFVKLGYVDSIFIYYLRPIFSDTTYHKPSCYEDCHE